MIVVRLIVAHKITLPAKNSR